MHVSYILQLQYIHDIIYKVLHIGTNTWLILKPYVQLIHSSSEEPTHYWDSPGSRDTGHRRGTCETVD
jgi:hypothetical protein